MFQHNPEARIPTAAHTVLIELKAKRMDLLFSFEDLSETLPPGFLCEPTHSILTSNDFVFTFNLP